MKFLLLAITMVTAFPVLAGSGLERLIVNDGYLSYQGSGEGEVILTIHGALVADSFVTIVDEPALKDYRLIRYHRRGYSDSASLGATAEGILDRSVADIIALLDHLEVDRAHVVGHSLGGVIAMGLAMRWPDRVQTLMLLEPPIMAVSAAGAMREQIGPALAYYEAGNSDAAVDAFLARLIRPEWQEFMESRVPGAIDQAVTNADTFFGIELPALAQQAFDAEGAARLSMPTLYVLGSESSGIAHADGFFEQGKALLMNNLPNAESRTLEGIDHSLQIGFPDLLAPIIADFADRHPIDD